MADYGVLIADMSDEEQLRRMVCCCFVSGASKGILGDAKCHRTPWGTKIRKLRGGATRFFLGIPQFHFHFSIE